MYPCFEIIEPLQERFRLCPLFDHVPYRIEVSGDRESLDPQAILDAGADFLMEEFYFFQCFYGALPEDGKYSTILRNFSEIYGKYERMSRHVFGEVHFPRWGKRAS
jgi:hypothetical protein